MRPAAAASRRIEGVAIGASAGSVEALSILLPALPVDFRAALFVVVHLPRERPSFLAEIFGAKCLRPVREAEDNETVEPGTVYFAPPDYHLLVDAGPRIALSVDGLVNYSRPSIDVLFESAAAVYSDRLLGIILTGANEDGSAGLAAVRRAGGMTMVQDPEGAKASCMPLSALERTSADFVLSLEDMADFLGTLETGTASDRPRKGY